jgi:hypothetical protein
MAMWDTIKDYMNSFIGIALLVLPIFFIPEVKKSNGYKIFITIASIILLWLGCDSVGRNKIKDNKIDTLSTNINTISKKLNDANYMLQKKTDSTNQFIKALQDRFKIGIKNGMPFQINTNIEKADNVYIGSQLRAPSRP